MAPCCLSPCLRVWEIWLYWILSALCGGIWVYSWEGASHVQDMRENIPATERHSLTLLTCQSVRKKGNRIRNSSPAMSRRSRNASPAMSRKSSVVSWIDSLRERSEQNGEDAVMEDCTETHQAEINVRSKQTTNCKKKSSRTCQRNKVGSKNRRIIWSGSRKRSNRSRRNVWKYAKMDRG